MTGAVENFFALISVRIQLLIGSRNKRTCGLQSLWPPTSIFLSFQSDLICDSLKILYFKKHFQLPNIHMMKESYMVLLQFCWDLAFTVALFYNTSVNFVKPLNRLNCFGNQMHSKFVGLATGLLYIAQNSKSDLHC